MSAVGIKKSAIVEEIVIIVGLVAAQFLYAGNAALLSYLLSLGGPSIDPLSVVVITSSATFILVFPFSLCFERTKWCHRYSSKLLFQMFFASLAGVVLSQCLFLMGIKMTSPALATAMPNIAPAIIFIIAWALRLENVKISCLYSKVKIAGTFICVFGAIMMSLFHSSKHDKISGLSASPSSFFDKDKITGSVYLLVAVFSMAASLVLQAAILVEFQAPMSLCAIMNIMAAATIVLFQLIRYHILEYGVFGKLLGYYLLVVI